MDGYRIVAAPDPDRLAKQVQDLLDAKQGWTLSGGLTYGLVCGCATWAQPMACNKMQTSTDAPATRPAAITCPGCGHTHTPGAFCHYCGAGQPTCSTCEGAVGRVIFGGRRGCSCVRGDRS